MADKKITQLTQHTSLIDSDVFAIVDITAAAGGGDHTITTVPVIRNISIIDPIEIKGWGSGDDPVSLIGVENYYVKDSHRILVRNNTGAGNVSISDHYSVETNSGASGSVTLDDDIEPGPSLFTFEVHEAQTLRIDPETGSGIYPGNGLGKYWESNTVGNRLTLRRNSATEWFVVEEIGTWTKEA